MGPIIPLTPPRMVIDALESVEVQTSDSGPSGFQLRFQFSSKSELNTIFLIAAGNNTSMATPPLRVLLIVTLNGTPTAAVRRGDDQRGSAGREPGFAGDGHGDRRGL